MTEVAVADSVASSIREAVSSEGFSLLEGSFDRPFCERVNAFIDGFPHDEAEINYGGSELRIWRAHERNAEVAEFRGFADDLLSRIFGKRIESHDVLAIRNLPVADDDALTLGRWHLDSLRKQVKVFLFLSDVSERSGPLEVLPGSHRPEFKALGLAKGQLLGATDLIGSTRRYQKLDDRWVDEVAQGSGASRAITCPAGTAAVVDTSAIHRARPCLENSRYALTAYYHHF